ncbi:photosystem II stability/assembly factor-like uncharacterized protein [Luteibacter rhizovicinus]|uniref:Photosystem II stability/assembly factor-like uncharacterized protein n=1 Tax=Luteibacter rhizovicinus TaxID=242606 RepID=A0A4R3YM82_9GAMM|nr:YCF48-related protein [Luteibacter rhizovicinus]TCV93416.1 photosystem II stability/assembly factor-like uncharacterized protein [Luteibacter rhizovicinus]
MTIRWLSSMLCGLTLCACSAQAPSPKVDSTPAAATTAAQAAYPRCPSSGGGGKCIDLSDGLNPYEFTARDYKALAVPLQSQGHAATAFGLPGADTFLNDIAVSPSGRVFAVGGPGLQVASSDGDSGNWHIATHMPYANTLNGIVFRDADRAFTVGDSAAILRTLDAGSHWEAFNATFPSYKDPQYKALRLGGDDRGKAYAVAFADADHGVVVGQSGVRDTVEAGILRTSDGGQHWERVALPNAPENVALQQVTFANAKKGWAIGSLGTVLRTDDAGAGWTVVPLGGTDVHLMGLSFSGPDHGCIAGGYKVWCTWDGGQQWQPATVDVPKKLDENEALAITRLRMRDAEHGWFITRDGLIFASEDGGRHWKLWMNVVEASHGKLEGVELWGLTMGRDRVWVVGIGSFAAPTEGKASLSSSPLIVSWPW